MKINVNIPLTNPKLEELLQKRAKLNPKDESATFSLMNETAEEIAMNAHFLAPTSFDKTNIKEDEDGNIIFGNDTDIKFVQLQGPDKCLYFPAFTNWDELRKWNSNDNVDALILSFDDYCTLICNSNFGIVIDPFGANLILDNKTINHIKENKDMITTGHTNKSIKKGTEVLIGDPENYPTEMAAAIKEYAKTDKNIKAVWLKLMKTEDEESFLLAVDFKGNREAVFANIAKIATPHLPKGNFLDMVSVYEPGIGTTAAKGTPLYKKKGFLGLF